MDQGILIIHELQGPSTDTLAAGSSAALSPPATSNGVTALAVTIQTNMTAL